MLLLILSDPNTIGGCVRRCGSHESATGLFVLALLYTIYFARPVLLPLTLGLILDFLFRPVVRALKRWRVPEPAGAALVILALVGGPDPPRDGAVILFVALTFWWWAWGIPGALLAVPLMAILKIFSDRMETLAPLGALLEE